MIGQPGPHGTVWDPDAKPPCASPGCGHDHENHLHNRKGTDCSKDGCECTQYRRPLPKWAAWIREMRARRRP